MAQTDKELEKQLMDAGNRLLSPPSSVDELLALLDRVENFLARVEQSPSESMKKALSPSMKALIADKLLRHSDIDVKVAVASCISEITRITAPDAPYEDDQMKEVFQLIVSSFEKLDDKSSPSYIKRTSILETVAKVRSCVVMLDLECDALIIEMFQHFLRSIRDDHPEIVFSSMETIMTLVLEESEDISLDLLSPILDILKTENKNVLLVARQLGEKVIEKCASKLKPYLLPALKSHGGSLEDYSKVVADVCQMELQTIEARDEDAGSKNVADESHLTSAPAEKEVEVAMETLEDAPPSEEVGPTTIHSPKSVMSNGNLQKEIEDTSACNDSSKEGDHDARDEVKIDAQPSNATVDSVNVEELSKSQSKAEKTNKRKGRKTNLLKSSLETAEPIPADEKKEAVKIPEHQEKETKDVESKHCDVPVADGVEPAENEKEDEASFPSAKTSENKPVDVLSPSPSGSLADESHSEKVGKGKEDGLVQNSMLASNVDSMKADEESTLSESKSHKGIGKKIDKEDSGPSSLDASKKDDEKTSELDVKLAKQSGKKVADFSSQPEEKKKRGQGKGTPGKDFAKTPSKAEKKKPVSLLKPTAKSTKDESDVEQKSKTSPKRKHRPGEEASKTKVHGPELVGSRIKVWWPVDKKFYKGVIDSFDSAKKRHRVSYDDGDEELLKLAKEKWEFIDDDDVDDDDGDGDDDDKGQGSGGEGPGDSTETPKRKKAKTSAGQGTTKRGKTEINSKKRGASTSRSKSTPVSGRKQKDDSKVDGKSKEEASKSVGKTDEDKGGRSKDPKSSNKSYDKTPKSVGKTKDDVIDKSKGTHSSKQDTPKGGATKSKGKTPKSGGKSTTNGTGKTKASSLAKEEEPEQTEKSPETPKVPEKAKGKSPSTSKSQKSVNKRKRGSKG